MPPQDGGRLHNSSQNQQAVNAVLDGKLVYLHGLAERGQNSTRSSAKSAWAR
jgi:hypothetical protein